MLEYLLINKKGAVMLLALAGVTGIGKTFLAEEIERELSFKKIHTIRTREIRNGEINGKTGFFISTD